MTELRVLRQVRHPNVALFYGAIIDTRLSGIALVLELVAGASLEEFICGDGFAHHPRPAVSEVDRFSVLLGVSSALQYLHFHRPIIVHGDLKPTNVLVEPPGVASRANALAKLVDFGLSRVLKGAVRPLGGSLLWAAPELSTRGACRPNVASDVFSFGRIVFFVALGLKPYDGASYEEIKGYIERGEVRPPVCSEIASVFEQDCWDIGIVCVEDEPCDRPGMNDVYEQLHDLRLSPGLHASLAQSAITLMPARASEEEMQHWCRGVMAVHAQHQLNITDEGAVQTGGTTMSRSAPVAGTALPILQEREAGGLSPDRPGRDGPDAVVLAL
mmetsp:Transcript_114509/g.330815  ORF Transcript_114509/g.330815 Transcript_114509/m.330815 type:complete len:329 (-) Transcript_114509:96-1082(-)